MASVSRNGSPLSVTCALRIENVSFSYGPKSALEGVSFEVPFGRCTMLLGPNGAGKTTLFNLITRLFDPPSGRIEITGFDIRKQFLKALKNLGVVFQQPTLDLDLTVEQNLRYHAALHGLSRKETTKRIEEELERLELLAYRKAKVRALSGGFRRRVEIARALLHRPKLLLLDEPTVGLDIPSREKIVADLHGLVKEREMGILWATHLIDEIEPEDRLVILHRGRVQAKGIVEEVVVQFEQETLAELFHHLTAN